MSVEPYPNQSTIVGDLYTAKADELFEVRQLLIKTGSTIYGKIEVTKFTTGSNDEDVIGICTNRIPAASANREISILVHGPANVIVAKNVTAGQLLKGSLPTLTETFSGDNTAQQTVNVGNVPIGVVTSFKEDNPTTLTRVILPAVPTTDEYSLDDVTGELIIGGTSVSGTDNYALIYAFDEARLTPLIGYTDDEVVTVDTHVGTLANLAKFIEYVEASTGTETGACKIITQGTVATKEVKYDKAAGTLTFYATDAVTEAHVSYQPDEKACCRALESQTAGEMTRTFFNGVSA